MPDYRRDEPIHTVERTRQGDWFVTRTFILDGHLCVWDGKRLYLISDGGVKTSFAQLVPLEALPNRIYMPGEENGSSGFHGMFEIIVRWMPREVRNRHPKSWADAWRGVQALQSYEAAQKRKKRG